MAAFEELGRGVYCIDALYLEPRVASIYLLRDGDEAALVDTGTCHSLENVQATLRALDIDASQVRYVVPTHVHLDHAGGASAMMGAFEQATLLIHPRGARHMADPSRLVEGTVAVYGRERFEELYGRIDAIDERRMHIVEDGETISLGARELRFFDTPGHARHHFCIFDATSEGLFTGDTFGLSYDAMKQLPRGLLPTTPPTQFEPAALRESIARLAELRPRRLYLTHFGAFEDPLAQVASFYRWIDAYVDLCERLAPAGEADERRLEDELSALVLDGLSPGAARAQVAQVLAMDLHLNAQGLAYWWRSTHRD